MSDFPAARNKQVDVDEVIVDEVDEIDQIDQIVVDVDAGWMRCHRRLVATKGKGYSASQHLVRSRVPVHIEQNRSSCTLDR